MNRRSLGALAIVIIFLMIVVATAGLDNLPRDVRNSIGAASSKLNADQTELAQNRDYINRALSAEPVLFRVKARAYRDRLQQDSACLATAATQLATLEQIRKQNRRQDADKARAGLAKFDSQQQRCVTDTADMRAEAERWIQYKQELPKRLAAMKASYESLHAFDVDAAVAPAKKAMVDWPSKQTDLENRIAQLRSLKQQGEQAWDSTAQLRAAAESRPQSGNVPGDFDYATFFQKADAIDTASRQLKESAASVDQLAAQLYTSWDKMLVDADDNHGAREKVKFVRTKYPDSTLMNGQVSTEEKWTEVDSAALRNAEKSVGMVVERKPAGKYDSEAEHVVQPPAYAYVAPPGQSNAYGSWNNGVWSWLPQYLILRSVLNASRGPITTGDYYAYDQARRRGEVFYGRNDEFRWRHSPRTVPSGGSSGGILGRARDWANSRSNGTVTVPSSRAKPSWGSGAFGGSKYQSRGSYSGSKYQSRGSFGGFGSRSYSRGLGGAMRSFGRGGRR